MTLAGRPLRFNRTKKYKRHWPLAVVLLARRIEEARSGFADRRIKRHLRECIKRGGRISFVDVVR